MYGKQRTGWKKNKELIMKSEIEKNDSYRKRNNKLVSVVMPLYNAERYVFKAIDSILKQSYNNFELILIDDCSTDLTMSVVENIFDARIKIFHNEQNKGIAYSRNKGMELAQGEYIALMDDDDLAPFDRLEKEVEFLETNPQIDAVGGRYCLIDEEDTVYQMSPEALVNPKFIKAAFMFRDPLGNGSMMFRTKLVRDNSIYFRDKCLGMEDYLFWIEFSKYGAISNINDIMLCWRHIEGNETTRVLKERREARAEKLFEIQKYAIESEGLSLLHDEYKQFNKIFAEGQQDSKVTEAELVELFSILKKMILQAEEKELDNAKEISILCRRQFSKCVEYSDVWEKKAR